MISSSKRLSFPALAALALVAAGCSYSGEGQIPCVQDASCPTDYPVCGPGGKCIAGTPTAASVAITGVDGHAAADYLSGTVRVLVSARATSGVGSVRLASGSVNFPASTLAAATPLYAFDVDTTALTDGDAVASQLAKLRKHVDRLPESHPSSGNPREARLALFPCWWVGPRQRIRLRCPLSGSSPSYSTGHRRISGRSRC